MISLRHPALLWALSRNLGLGLGSTANLFGSYYFGRRSALQKVYPETVVITIPDCGKIAIRTNGYDFGLLAQIFVRKDYRLDASVVPGNVRTILDLGANIGAAAVYMHQQFPGSEIACVEPSPLNIALLKRAFSLNGIRGRVFEAAIGSDEGSIDLYLSDRPDCNSIYPSDDSSNKINVPLISVPHVMRQMGWDRIDLLKIDIEGAEKHVLGENNSWLQDVRMITGETHVNNGYQYAQMERDLNNFGFELEILIPETSEYGASFRGVNKRFAMDCNALPQTAR
ncbi:MAG: hypothetical protein QOJ99_753 [Bryobacterales bacterium]|jgi:FkbM family methyltransferase|nr:hypothetical protein [Bryobacterales bacterium]